MLCPVCKTDSLGPSTLVEGLPAHRCETCRGVWIDSNAYLAWRQARGLPPPPATSASRIDPAWEMKDLKLCPNCGRILGRFKVLPGEPLFIDRCHTCNGVWLDHHEWSALVERSLHESVNEFFTRAWQTRVRTAEMHAHMDRLYREKFGPEDYARIQEVRAWLEDNERRWMLLAFLQSEDPYKP